METLLPFSLAAKCRISQPVEPRRIIITVTNDLSMDQRVHRIATALSEAGWSVAVVGRKLPSSVEWSPKGYQTHRLILRVLRGKWFYFWFNFRLFFYLLWQKTDWIYCCDMDTLPAGWLAARLRGKRVAHDAHEYWTEVPELISRPRTRAVWLWLERRLFKRVDVAITVNDALAATYGNIYRIPVHALYNYPTRKPSLEREAPGKVILYQGALNMGRGIELMIACMAHLPADYVLHIAGAGPLEASLKMMAQHAEPGGRVVFWGHIPMDQLHQRTQAAALGLSLEEGESQSYQMATPNKVFDYVQAGTPCLVSNLPLMRGIVEKYGVGEILPAEERTPELLARRIQSMVENGEKWLEYHRNALEAASSLCWEMEKGKLIALFPPNKPN